MESGKMRGHILVFQSTITSLQPPSNHIHHAPLVLPKYPGISQVWFTRNLSSSLSANGGW